MAELHHMNHNHPLLFNEDSGCPRHTTYLCAGCTEGVKGPSYSCGECEFYLHKKCAEAPLKIHHPAHRDHPLLFLPASEYEEREVRCSFCEDKVWGFIYHCSSCKFYLDFFCALLPRYTSAGNFIETLHTAHPHPLVSINPIDDFHCSGCNGTIKIDDASYYCYELCKYFHKKCLELPSTINHPCHRTHQLLLAYKEKVEYSPHATSAKALFCWDFIIVVSLATLTFTPDVLGHHSLLKTNLIMTTLSLFHRDCISLPRHIRLTLHPHPISHCFFICTDDHDSGDWDCKICFEKVNIEYGSYYCSRLGCDFVIHVNCASDVEKKDLYGVVEVENPDEFEESDLLLDESTSSIIRIIKEIEVGDEAIAAEIEHISHEHNLIFSDETMDNTCCNGCVLPILSSFYYCPHCDFFLHKACAELRKMCRQWHLTEPFNLITMSHFLFFDNIYKGKCNACGKALSYEKVYRCKDCTFALNWRCVTLPRNAWHKCDQHSLTLAHQDRDDYPLRHYCDICEEGRDPQKWFYHCGTCDNAMHIECVLGKYPFIKVGSKYTYEGHPPITTLNAFSVRNPVKIWPLSV
ncbi:hypothetical protein F3Y22_tig00111298pilonHSYRG00067 [Hibiscus syriacus]|uniref:Phorbol-ester/DAG-type domain-containing protein n=1 Tax=Hibiscus syriacus TaxID=106335 RepID=A0A6A2YR59_HIBSY|nr:hypothetical protein F3Y22_tig00111298pilonHSYRG00067 [Hibiscus syriacus]